MTPLVFWSSKSLSVVSPLLMFLFLPNSGAGFGVEGSLLLTQVATILTFINFFRTPSYLSATWLGLALLANILVRPTLLPLVMLVVLLLLGFKKAISPHIPFRFAASCLGIAVAGIVITSAASHSLYGDGRLLSGTYSSIPLHSAFNPHIPLEAKYNSRRWRAVDAEVLKEIGTSELAWQDRDRRLKGLVVDFIKGEPMKAWRGYVWRLRQYTTNSEGMMPLLFVLASAAQFGLIIYYHRARKFVACGAVALAMLATVYSLTVQSLFAYAGVRYCVALIPYYVAFLVVAVAALNTIDEDVERTRRTAV